MLKRMFFGILLLSLLGVNIYAEEVMFGIGDNTKFELRSTANGVDFASMVYTGGEIQTGNKNITGNLTVTGNSNITGTLTNDGKRIIVPSSIVNIGTGTALTITDEYMFIKASGTISVTSNATPFISTSAYTQGTIVTIMGSTTTLVNVTLRDNDTISGTLLKLANSTRIIDNDSSLRLVLKGNRWVEENYTNSSGSMTYKGTLGITGASTLSGNTSVGGTLGVTGATTLSNTVSLDTTTVNKTLAVTGTSAFTGASSFTGAISANNATFTGITGSTVTATFGMYPLAGGSLPTTGYNSGSLFVLTTDCALYISTETVSKTESWIKVGSQ